MTRVPCTCLVVLSLTAHAQFGTPVVVTDDLQRSIDFITFDPDGDGDTDVLTSSAPDSLLVYYVNDGTGAFTDSVHVSHLPIFNGLGNLPNDLAAVDLDEDGDMDIIQIIQEPAVLHWYANDGTGHFGPRTWLLDLAPDHAFVSEVLDINGDGLADVLLGIAGSISWLRNTGTTSFELVSTTVGTALNTAAGDMDGDGDPDVAFIRDHGWDLSETVDWIANDGEGNFSQVVSGPALTDASPLYVADLDGDEDNDLLVGRCWGANDGWRLYANDGTGIFSFASLVADGCGMAAAIADIDEDSDADILLLIPSLTSWMSNTGNGTFLSPQSIVTLTPANPGVNTTVAVADMNGDGHLDVIDSHQPAPGTFTPIHWYGNLMWQTSLAEVPEEGVLLFPVPMRDAARISFPASCTPPVVLSLVDATGRTRRTWWLGSLSDATIDRNGWESGMYILHITDGKGRSYSKRVVVE